MKRLAMAREVRHFGWNKAAAREELDWTWSEDDWTKLAINEAFFSDGIKFQFLKF